MIISLGGEDDVGGFLDDFAVIGNDLVCNFLVLLHIRLGGQLAPGGK